jgi:hypothetical protein
LLKNSSNCLKGRRRESNPLPTALSAVAQPRA